MKTCCSIGVLSREYRSFVVVDSETMELQIKQIKQNEYFFVNNYQKLSKIFWNQKRGGTLYSKIKARIAPCLDFGEFCHSIMNSLMEIASTEHLFHLYALQVVHLPVAEDEHFTVAE